MRKQEVAQRSSRLSFLFYFVWVPVVAVFVWVLMSLGSIYIIWSYEWRPTGRDSYANFEHRHYTRCTYASIKGATITELAVDGKCGWLRFRFGSEEDR